MIGHINNILSLRDRLFAIGEDIADSLLCALLLCSVPHSFDPLFTAVEVRNEEYLKLEFIKNKFMDEYKHRCENREANSSSKTIFIKIE